MLFIIIWLAILATGSCQSSCVGRCGAYADSSYSCQCNSLCDTYNDCCPDYVATCLPSETCAGRCGELYDSSNACHCNADCIYHNNCCLDYQSLCSSASGSCYGRCDTAVDSNQPCQCNSACENYNDCCSDYSSVCSAPPSTGTDCASESVTSNELLEVSLELFDLDINRALTSEVTTNRQSPTSDSSTVDQSPDKFFTYVSGDFISKPTFRALEDLLDNYEKIQGIDEDVSEAEIDEQDTFLNEFMATSVGKRLYEFLASKGKAGCEDETTFKENLKKIWFGLYSRKNGAMDTSGFEHTFVGEIKSGSVSGFHNWFQFYLQEQQGRVNYYGYVGAEEPDLFGLHFTWDGYMKGLGSSPVGSSPEYELAIYTLCHVSKPDSVCKILMRDDNNSEVTRSIQTWTWSKTSPGNGMKYVASSYFIV